MSDHAETHNPPVSCYEQVGYCVNPLVVQTLLLLLLVFCVVLIICNWNNEYKSTPPPQFLFGIQTGVNATQRTACTDLLISSIIIIKNIYCWIWIEWCGWFYGILKSECCVQFSISSVVHAAAAADPSASEPSPKMSAGLHLTVRWEQFLFIFQIFVLPPNNSSLFWTDTVMVLLLHIPLTW